MLFFTKFFVSSLHRYSRYCCKPPAISLFKSRILSFISSSTLVWNLSFFKALSYFDYHSIRTMEQRLVKYRGSHIRHNDRVVYSNGLTSCS